MRARGAASADADHPPTSDGAIQPSGEVTLCIPTRLEFVPIARVTAASYATRLGFDIDEVEDIRIAIDELASVLIESGDGHDLILSFATLADAVRLNGKTTMPPPNNVVPSLDRITEQILGAVVDEFSFSIELDVLHFAATRRRASGSQPWHTNSA